MGSQLLPQNLPPHQNQLLLLNQQLLQLQHLPLLKILQLIANSTDKSFPTQEIAMTTMFALRTETEVTISTSKYFLVEMIGYMTQILDHALGQKKLQMTF